jgi:transposase
LAFSPYLPPKKTVKFLIQNIYAFVVGGTPRFTRQGWEIRALRVLFCRAGKRTTLRRGGLLETAGKQETTVPLLMDKAYADFTTRFTAWDLRFQPVVPPKTNMKDKWEYDKERNEIERFFRRLKAFRAVFARYGKLDIMFSGTILFVSIIILLRCVNTP